MIQQGIFSLFLTNYLSRFWKVSIIFESFKGLLLLFQPNFPGSMLIRGSTPIRDTRVLYIFGNLQSLSIWTREVKSVGTFSVHDILSGMYRGLLHKIENVYKHSKEIVYVNDSITRRSTRESIVRHTSYINDSAGKDCVDLKNWGTVENSNTDMHKTLGLWNISIFRYKTFKIYAWVFSYK